MDDKQLEAETPDVEEESLLRVTGPVSDEKEVTPPCTNELTESPAGSPAPRRSGRIHKPLDWITKYVSSSTDVKCPCCITYNFGVTLFWFIVVSFIVRKGDVMNYVNNLC